MKALVHVTLKKTVLDPQGRAIQSALSNLGHQGVKDVRQGKFFEIELDAAEDRPAAEKRLDRIASEVLANPVIEDYSIEIVD